MIASLFILIISLIAIISLENYNRGVKGDIVGKSGLLVLQVMIYLANFLYFLIIFIIYTNILDGIILIFLCIIGISFIILAEFNSKKWAKEDEKRRQEWKMRRGKL